MKQREVELDGAETSRGSGWTDGNGQEDLAQLGQQATEGLPGMGQGQTEGLFGRGSGRV